MNETILVKKVEILIKTVKYQSLLFIFIGAIFTYFNLIETWFKVPNNYGYAFALAGWIAFPLISKGKLYLAGKTAI